jgi:hypothetical protein
MVPIILQYLRFITNELFPSYQRTRESRALCGSIPIIFHLILEQQSGMVRYRGLRVEFRLSRRFDWWVGDG